MVRQKCPLCVGPTIFLRKFNGFFGDFEIRACDHHLYAADLNGTFDDIGCVIFMGSLSVIDASES